MLRGGAKRFYTSVDVKSDGGTFAVVLDGKPIKTPAGRLFTAPTRALADAIAQEWRAQGERIDPEKMTLTKALNTAIDRVVAHRRAIIDELAKFAESDMLCYRAADPEELVRRQSAAWDSWLAWARERFGARLIVVTGMTHVEQPREAIERQRCAIADHTNHRLVALHAGVTITGSAVLGLAFVARAMTADEAFSVAHVDEDFQAERWGRDAEAKAVGARRLAELKAAETFLELLAT